MIAVLRRRRIVGTAAYIGIGLAVLFFQLMPLNPGQPGLPGPDLILCVTFAWVLRRPVVTSALIGASRVSQIEDVFGALKNTTFSQEELDRIDEILKA